MGVSPNIWGPNLWGTLHLLCLAGTITPNFVQQFAAVIPCPMCASHFSDLLTENPFPDSDDPSVLFEWSVRLHNLVNARLGKPIFSTEQAMQKWTGSGPVQFDFKIALLVLTLVIFIIILLKLK